MQRLIDGSKDVLLDGMTEQNFLLGCLLLKFIVCSSNSIRAFE
jgi:hypothetical protein